MQYKIGICSECGKERMITKPLKKLCRICNQRRLDSGKEIKPMKRKFPKPTGEKNLFMAIWAVRPHVCTKEREIDGQGVIVIYKKTQTNDNQL